MSQNDSWKSQSLSVKDKRLFLVENPCFLSKLLVSDSVWPVRGSSNSYGQNILVISWTPGSNGFSSNLFSQMERQSKLFTWITNLTNRKQQKEDFRLHYWE